MQWLRGSKVDVTQRYDAINDAVESLFETLLRASTSVLMGGPVTISLAAAAERTTIVTIVDPTVAPTVSDAAATDQTLAAHTVNCAYTYVTASGTETLISPATAHTTAMGFVAAVHPPALVAEAIGWNLYAQTTSVVGVLVKQNDEPLEFLNTGGVYYNEPDAGFTNDPDAPLPPTENTTGDNIFYIRHMEVVTTSQLLRSWNQGDIDSDMMRRLGMTFAGNSNEQAYGFDLINQRQIEIRPALGTSISARYYFVVKPRRMMFENSPMPFPTVPSTEFIRNFALSGIFLSLREISLAREWEAKAEKARSRCELAIAATNRPKNQRITMMRI